MTRKLRMSKQVNVNLTEQQYLAIEEIAERCSLNMGTLIRKIIVIATSQKQPCMIVKEVERIASYD